MKTLLVIFYVLTITILSQERTLQLSGNLSEDLVISSKDFVIDENETSVVIKKKPPILAAGLSAIIPGAGQFYNDDYWKSAIFVVVEVATIITAISYNTKGNDQTKSYQNFANSEKGWNVNKYAHWSVDNASRINSEIKEGNPILNIFDSNGDVVWNKLNSLETKIGSWYSHQLAPFDDQQYYEMIGKYQQFNPGWADFNYSDAYTYGDPLTKTFLWYADERGEANSYYDISNLAVKILVANHIISAVEAAFSANRYNKKLNAEVKMQSSLIGFDQVFYPEINLSYRF